MKNAWRDYIHTAIRNLHPGAGLVRDYVWMAGPDGEPFMQSWDEARLGQLDLQAIQTEAERLMAEASKPKPRSIHVAWFKAALAEMGALDRVNAAVSGLPKAKQILWEYATSIDESDADVSAIASALGLDIATIFDQAERIRDGRAA